MKLHIHKRDIKEFTGLQGYSLFNHQRRKKHILRLIAQTLSPESKILDVGCASGDIALELSFLGFQVQGIDSEPSRLDAATKLAAKYGQAIQFENKSLDEVGEDQKYVGILLGEVLEHFSNPTSILVHLKKFLSPQGRIIITTPNMPSLRNRLKFAFLGIFPDNNPEHKCYFDYQRFQRVAKNAGYQILYFRTCFTHIFARSERSSHLEHLATLWISYVFRKSGDTLFAVISQES